jgi:hypothetical protein
VPKTTAAAPDAVENQIEKFRQLVIASRSNPDVGPDAEKSLERLNALFADDPEQFTAEDVRWVNVLRGYLAIRLAAHGPKDGPHTKKAKRKGDQLDHCWRCQTTIDERFTQICPTCDSKEYHWRTCPVCHACGCQRTGKMLV